MQVIEILTALQEDIIINFITRLLRSTDLVIEVKYNIILIIINRFIKSLNKIKY